MHNWPLDMHPNAEFFSVGIFNLHKKKRIDTRIEKDWKWHPIRIQLLLRLSIVIQITSGRFSMHFSNRNLLCHVSQPQPKMVELQNTFSDALYSFCHPYTTVVDDVENCLARKTYLKVKSIVTRETWERKTIEAIRSRKLFYALLLSKEKGVITQCTKIGHTYLLSTIVLWKGNPLETRFLILLGPSLTGWVAT